MLTPMKADMRRAKADLLDLLAANSITSGMVVRAHGDHLIVAREEELQGGEVVLDDRVRLTRITASRWGLSVKRHTGRWEKTPFSGSMKEMVEAIWTYMQHLVARY